MAEKAKYRVTMPKNWTGPVRVSVRGLSFDRRQEDKNAEDSRVKQLHLDAREAADLTGAGFLLVEAKGDAPTSRLSERVKAPAKAADKVKE